MRIVLLPLQPVDHVSHQGIGDAGVGLLSQQDGLPQLIQDHRVPVHLLLSRLQLGVRGEREGGRDLVKLISDRLDERDLRERERELINGKYDMRKICDLR